MRIENRDSQGAGSDVLEDAGGVALFADLGEFGLELFKDGGVVEVGVVGFEGIDD